MSEAKSTSLEELKTTFMNYCQFGDKNNQGLMNGKIFAKLCVETKIIDKKTVTATDVDLIFTKVKKTARTIPFKTFKDDALPLLAAKKFKDEYKESEKAAVAKLIDIICKQKVPVSSGTKADKVKFHDDKSTYTGVHKAGGPSTSDNRITLSSLADRSASDARGRKMTK